MGKYILTADHIQKTYGGNVVLKDVTLQIRKGEIYGLVGKNGAGKTTLFRILTGLVPKYSGSISYFETDNHPVRISAVINSPALFLNMSAYNNLKHQLLLLKIYDNSKIYHALKLVGLENNKHKQVRHFSQGMIQRLKLAVALLENPEILLLDEPVNGLDPDGIAELRELLIRLNHENGMTILISSHNLNELERVATCIGILHDGQIVKEEYVKNILANGVNLEEMYLESVNGGKLYDKHSKE